MGYGYKRSKQVGEQIMHEVSNMITVGEIRDPRVSSVVITNFHLTDDMGYLKLYFMTISESLDISSVKQGLASATKFIRQKLGSRVRLKKLPKIEFEYDKVLENAYKVDGLIKEVIRD